MKKICALGIVMLLSLPGCWGRKEDQKKNAKNKKVAFQSEVSIPVTEDITSRYDDDVNEFALLEDEAIDALWAKEEAELETAQADTADQDDFFWVEDVVEKEDSFKNVYFDFDAQGIREDQEEYISQNIEKAKRIIVAGDDPKIIIEGNACSSAGSRTYNIAKSNNRAQIVAERFIANGVPRENIKIVGRGSDNPSLDEAGNPIMGGKEDQWANRRVEIKVYA